MERTASDQEAAHLEYTQVRAENARLRQIIIDYARHNEGCSAAFGDKYRCRCGWRDVEAEFKSANSQKDA